MSSFKFSRVFAGLFTCALTADQLADQGNVNLQSVTKSGPNLIMQPISANPSADWGGGIFATLGASLSALFRAQQYGYIFTSACCEEMGIERDLQLPVTPDAEVLR